jgi:hypothetical protein
MRRVDPHGLALTMIETLTWVPDASAIWAGTDQGPWTLVLRENR